MLHHGDDAWHPERYTAPNPQAAEDQLADFLWGLVRLTQPDNVLEFGAHYGDTTLRLAQALLDNDCGYLTAVEIDPDYAEVVRSRLEGGMMDTFSRVLVGSFDEVNLGVPGGYQVAYLDSLWERDREFETARPHLSPGAFVVMHDAGKHHNDGRVRVRIRRVLARPDVVGMYWPTPRGVVIAQYRPVRWSYGD